LLNPEIRNPASKKRPHSPVPVTPLKLRNGREVERIENGIFAFSNFTPEELSLDVAQDPAPETNLNEVQQPEVLDEFRTPDEELNNSNTPQPLYESYSEFLHSDASMYETPNPPTPITTQQHQVPESQPIVDSQASLAVSQTFSIIGSISSTGSRRIFSSSVKRGEVPIILPGISSVGKSERRCFVCKSAQGRRRIPNSALLDIWIQAKVLVPEDNRTCSEHLDNGRFTSDAITLIQATRTDAELTGQQISSWLINITKKLSQRHRPVDFNVGSPLTDNDYKLLTGITRDQFRELVGVLKENKMRESGNRSLRNALGIFLVMLRLNVSQRVLAFLFGITSQSIISETIDAVTEVLIKNFVPLHLGYGHLTRDQLMTHMRPMYTKLLDRNDEELILILDGTIKVT
jgi:hypothetical protein